MRNLQISSEGRSHLPRFLIMITVHDNRKMRHLGVMWVAYFLCFITIATDEDIWTQIHDVFFYIKQNCSRNIFGSQFSAWNPHDCTNINGLDWIWNKTLTWRLSILLQHFTLNWRPIPSLCETFRFHPRDGHICRDIWLLLLYIISVQG